MQKVKNKVFLAISSHSLLDILLDLCTGNNRQRPGIKKFLVLLVEAKKEVGIILSSE